MSITAYESAKSDSQQDPCAVGSQASDALDIFDAPPLDEQMQDILESFDFTLMANVMRSLDWKWMGINEVTGEPGFIPGAIDLRFLAERMLIQVAGEDSPFVPHQTCGFVAQKRHGYLALYFVPTYWEVSP